MTTNSSVSESDQFQRKPESLADAAPGSWEQTAVLGALISATKSSGHENLMMVSAGFLPNFEIAPAPHSKGGTKLESAGTAPSLEANGAFGNAAHLKLADLLSRSTGDVMQISEKFSPSKPLTANSETTEKLKNFTALLHLMDNFAEYAGGGEKITKVNLETLARNAPELKNTIDFALKNFDSLSADGVGITRESLKQPLLQNLSDAITSSIKDGKLPPEVQTAIASWAMFPDEKSAQYLEKRLNEGLKDSDYSVTIKSGTTKGVYGADLPVTKVTLTNRQTKESADFSYSFDMPGASGLKGKNLDNGIFLLDKEQGDATQLAKHLSAVKNLQKLYSMFEGSDRKKNEILSEDQLSAGHDASVKKFVKDNFKDLSGDATGVSKQKVRDAYINALGDAVAEMVKLNSGKLPADIRQAFQEMIGYSATKDELAAMQKALNAKLASTGYELQLTLENQKGRHGDTVRQVTVTLVNTKHPGEQSSFSYSYDTVRGR